MRALNLGFVAVVFSLLGVGCSSGDQADEEIAACEVFMVTPLAVEEVSPLGFSAKEMLGFVEGEHFQGLRYADGEEADAAIRFQFDGGASYQEREWISAHGDGAELPADGCGDVVELEMTVTISTTDGALDESWAVGLQSEDGKDCGICVFD